MNRSYLVKKWLVELMQDKYAEHDQIVERVSSSLVTNKDLEDFAKFITQIYETGYKKAVTENQKQLEKLGYHVEVVTKG